MTANPHTGSPSPMFQIQFIEQFQRLLESGSFVASYKYALILALCNVAAEKGFDDTRPQPVELDDLGHQFLKLYWSHARDYPGLGEPLSQNTGKQAAILRTVAQARSLVPQPDRAGASQSVPERLVKEATDRVKTMPLMKLQTVGTQRADPDHPDHFLYPTRLEQGCIILRPGVSACLRRFRSLIISSTQSAWAEFVRRQNPRLGAGHDLEQFLFGSQRSAVASYAEALIELQQGRCFYTGRSLRHDDVDVDHFIPWARFPMDSPFNLVAAGASVNRQKSDHLAALPHLAKWIERNERSTSALLAIGAHDADQRRANGIARWAYGSADRVGSLGWLRGKQLCSLHGWDSLLLSA